MFCRSSITIEQITLVTVDRHPMRSLPESDKIEFDLFGNAHLICVEDRAINIILERLKNTEYNCDRIHILQLGTTKIKQGLRIEQFCSIENLQAKLIEILDRAMMGMRFYAIGSEQFVWHLRGCALSFGLSEAEISLEVIDSEAKNIYCSNCQIINPFVNSDIFICSNCGIELEVLEHFSRLKNAYLGICADAETPEQLAKV